MSSHNKSIVSTHDGRVSLSTLLFGSHLLLVAVAMIGFAAAMFAMSYRATYSQAESELLGATESLLQDLRNGTSPQLLEIPDTFFHRFGKAPRDRAYWCVWDRSGTRIGGGGELPETTTPNQKQPPRDGPRPFASRSTGPRLEMLLSTDEGGQLLVGRPLAKEFDALRRLLARLAGIGLAGIIAASGVAWWMTRRIVGPIVDLATKAQTITHQHLEERLALPQPTSEMTQLAISFNSMLANLQCAFMRQQQFTSDAAHELRTPVSIILSQSEFSLLRQRSSDDYRQGLETCRQAAGHMKRLVENLFEVSRIDSGQLLIGKQELDLANIADEAIQMMATLAQDRNLRMQSQMTSVFVIGDATRLRQIVLNLIANAIEYSVSGGEVLVTVDHDSGQARLSVADHGQGISQDDLPKIWNRFYRVDQARTQSGNVGAGLGLSLVAELVRLHGGNVAIESQLGLGTTVTVQLPSISRVEFV